jgi:hypothetical protein
MYALLYAYSRREALSARARLMLGIAASLVAALGLALCVRQVASNFIALRDWDFICFWTYGRAMALGQSPYDVQVLREIAAPLGPSAEFLEINVCLYPPICLPPYWPFGFLPFTASMAVWFGVQIAALVGSVALLRRIWDSGRTWLGLAVMLAVFFSWHSTALTLLYGQTNFLFLLAILGLVMLPSAIWRGIALGLAIVVKPIAAILLIDVALRRKWGTFASAFVPPVLALGAFLLLQGWPGFVRYLERDPKDIVFAYYDGPFNQSLLAVLLRWYESPPLAKPVFFPPFVILAGILTAATLAVLFRMRKDLAPLGVGYVLVLALMVYPGTQMYYTLWLLLPLGMLWQCRESLAGGRWVVPLTIAVAFGLGGSRWNFAAHLVVWLVMSVVMSLPRPTSEDFAAGELDQAQPNDQLPNERPALEVVP